EVALVPTEVELEHRARGHATAPNVGQGRSKETRLEDGHGGAQPMAGAKVDLVPDVGKAVLVYEVEGGQPLVVGNAEIDASRIDQAHPEDPGLGEERLVTKAFLDRPGERERRIEDR